MIATQKLLKIENGVIVENNVFPAGDKSRIQIVIAVTAFTGVIKIAGSLKKVVDFNSPATMTNQYSMVSFTDVSDGLTINGNTGESYTLETSVSMFTVNIETLESLGVIVENPVGDMEITVSANT